MTASQILIHVLYSYGAVNWFARLQAHNRRHLLVVGNNFRALGTRLDNGACNSAFGSVGAEEGVRERQREGSVGSINRGGSAGVGGGLLSELMFGGGVIEFPFRHDTVGLGCMMIILHLRQQTFESTRHLFRNRLVVLFGDDVVLFIVKACEGECIIMAAR